jgi:enoyl-CoA hydratase/carnithine racemase
MLSSLLLTLRSSPYQYLLFHDNATNVSLDEQLEYEIKTQRVLCDEPAFKEGVLAFLEKRKPNFRNLK